MRQLLITILIIFFSVRIAVSQINVFDCNTYVNQITQAELNAAQDHFGTCVTLGGNQSIIVSGAANKTVYASRQIQLKENFYAGSFNASGGLHLTIANNPEVDIVAMNYGSLNNILRYKKFELGIKLPAEILTRVNHFLLNEGVYSDELNPFLEWNVDVEATFYHPATGTYKTVDGYYHREYIENVTTHDWDDIGTDFPFRIRYAPPKNGKWIARVTIKINEQVIHLSGWFGFHVVESGDPGYVSVHPNKKNLVRGNEIIFPVGHNFIGPDENHMIQWGGGNTLGNNLNVNGNTTKAANILEWDHYLSKVESYFQQGGKYIRTLQAPWVSLIEFEKKGNYYDRLHYAWEQDKLLELCEQYDALMMFNMMIHTPLVISDGYRIFGWDWERWWIDENNNYFYDSLEQRPIYCYNDNPKEMGGKMPHEALSNEEDLKYHEQRTRYYIARYGYSTKIYEFELLSEPFNVDADARTGKSPYILPKNYTAQDLLDQQVLFNAIEKYQGRLGWFIKEKMGHTEHLVGVDYIMGWRPDVQDVRIDQSLHHGSIDIIGVNDYDKSHNKYIKVKSGSNNAYNSSENSRARAFKEFQAWANKPIIISEFGDGDGAYECSNYIGCYVDAMSMGFTGVCGYNLWEGKDQYQDFLWPVTIRAQNHMNGNDVISTLSNGSGQWVQGRQHEKIYGLWQNEAEAKELQYYISHNQETSVGYIRNRTYNIHTKRLNESCVLHEVFDGNNIPVDNLNNIAWDDGPITKRLKIQGLKNNTNYQVDWYSFKEGWYLGSDCRNTQSGELVLRFPKLFVTPDEVERPIVWFVVRQNNCMQGIMPVVSNDGIEAFLIEERHEPKKMESIEEYTIVYPNPFDDYIVVESMSHDILIIQDIKGKILFEQRIAQGNTNINTQTLLKGLYIITLVNQGIQMKSVKL